MAKIILINGKKRSGKDWTAKLIQEELYKQHKTSEIMSFAGPLKEIVADSFNISLELLDELKNDGEPIVARVDGFQVIISDFRLFLQRFGTEAMKKQFGDDIWVRLLKEKSEKSPVDYILVPDFRFLIEEISDITLKIRNDEIDNANKDFHPSETQLDNFNFKYVIDNTGKPDLTEQVREFVQKIL